MLNKGYVSILHEAGGLLFGIKYFYSVSEKEYGYFEIRLVSRSNHQVHSCSNMIHFCI